MRVGSVVLQVVNVFTLVPELANAPTTARWGSQPVKHVARATHLSSDSCCVAASFSVVLAVVAVICQSSVLHRAPACQSISAEHVRGSSCMGSGQGQHISLRSRTFCSSTREGLASPQISLRMAVSAGMLQAACSASRGESRGATMELGRGSVAFALP